MFFRRKSAIFARNEKHLKIIINYGNQKNT